MGTALLKEFVEQGDLDRSVVDGFDPYYEPSWWTDYDTFLYSKGSQKSVYGEEAGDVDWW